ncbi:hypothetical protein [Curtobacterium sp. MCBD17_021]|uniref:hypothetical protein n=1 Tax=Curtobacterium sp. MCBD17_021 TaxID=2175665 RepID=UPI000DA9A74F|nr:hypothetical protein [Curtobacterium sp. MCBD17_021]PZE68099.1 hypothetical protein DEI83_04015 [Curtobacterium sp. MCBD17_021]
MTAPAPRTARVAAWVAAHPWAGITVWSAVVFLLAASVARAFTYPPLNGGDEPAHFDYIITVWHGHLPVFEDGLTYRAPFGAGVPVQWVSQHPPLYYVLLAPVVGPLFDSGHALVAVMAGRLASAVLIACAVPAAAWGAWRTFPGARRLPGAVAVVTAMAGIVVQQGSSIYNDALYYPLVVLACAIAGAALRSGVGPKLLVAALLVGAAGMSTRLSFALWLIALVVAVLLAPHVRLGRLAGVPARIVAAALPVLAAGAASGWFYLRNKRLAGNYSGRHADWGLQHMGRVESSVTDVVQSASFWRGTFGIYRGVVDPLSWSTYWLLLLPLVLAVLAGIWVLVSRRRRVTHDAGATRSVARASVRAVRRDRLSTALVVAMYVVVTALLLATQVQYVSGGGAANTRYALTALPVIVVAMAAGLTAWRPLSGVLVGLWIAGAMPPYLSLVDLYVTGIVPHAATVVRLAFAVSLIGVLGCALGAFLDSGILRDARAAGRDEPAAAPEAPGARDDDQASAARSSVR